MQTCTKLQRSRGAEISTSEEMQGWLDWFKEHEIAIRSYYTSNNFDGENWRDWYSGKLSNEFFLGSEDKSLRKKCGIFGLWTDGTFTDYTCTPGESKYI